VLAPYWTDLHMGRAGAALRVATLTDGVNTWLVGEWIGKVFDSNATRSFQIWIQLGATEGIWYAFGSDLGPGDAGGLNTGAENRDGTSGKNLGSIPASNSDLFVATSGPTPGGKVTVTYDAFGRNAGVYDILATYTSNLVQGVTTDKETITVTK